MHKLRALHLPSVHHIPKPAAPAQAGTFWLAGISHILQLMQVPVLLRFSWGTRMLTGQCQIGACSCGDVVVSDKGTGKKENALCLHMSSSSHSGCVMGDLGFGDAPYSMVQFGH